MLYIREIDQRDTHFFFIILFQLNYPYMFWTNNYLSSGGYFCTRSIRYFTTHLWAV